MKLPIGAERSASSGTRRAPGTAPADPFPRQLEVLAEMARDFASTLDIDAALRHALELITEFVDAEGGALFLLEDGGRHLGCHACVGGVDITGLRLEADRGIVGRAVQRNEGIIVRDGAADPDFYGGVDAQTGITTRSILCAPLSVKEERIGAIELINKRGGDGLFAEADLLVLGALSDSAALAIVNARMAEKLVEQERLRRELELAGEIQRSLLPEDRGPGFPVIGLNRPARVVSGDFYDFFPLPDGRIAFSIGDVAGKGLNAALMMAKTVSLLRCLGKTVTDPGRLLRMVDGELCETATRGLFVTLAAGIYDPSSGCVRLANAGHEPPLLQTADGCFEAIPANSPPLGITAASGLEGPFPEITLHLDGGVLYLFTDGITEGYVAEGCELGVEGFKEAVARLEPGTIGDRITELADRIAGSGVPLRDDITVLAIDDGIVARPGARSGGGAPRQPEAPEPPEEVLLALRLSARADRLKLVRCAVDEAARLAGAGDDEARDVVLAVDEACQNVVRHAYGGCGEGELSIEVRRHPGKLVVLIRDFAEPIDPSRVKPRDLGDVRPGGLGTHFMREVMDEVEFLPPPFGGGNLLRLAKRLGR